MRSALLSVQGVKQATVVLDRREAFVEYDSARCSPEDLIDAVAKAKDPTMPLQFSATVKAPSLLK